MRNAPQNERWTEQRYLDWEAQQDRKHEFVNGRPRLMARAKAGHNRVARNLLAILHRQLRAGPCEPFGSDMKVRIPNGNYRYPDLIVDCGRPADDALHAADPRAVFEVLSPSTVFIDQFDKLQDYQSIPALAVVALLRPDARSARLFRREGIGWRHEDVRDPQGVVALPELGVEIPLAEAYEGVAVEQETP